MQQAFFAFPSSPPELRQPIDAAIEVANGVRSGFELLPWTKLQVSGQLVWQEVLEAIGRCDVFYADVSILNPNVTYEIGYAIGVRKPLRFTLNKRYVAAVDRNRIGIFDILGWQSYTGSEELTQFLTGSWHDTRPLHVPTGIDRKAPVYLVDAYEKSSIVTHVSSRVKKRLVYYRSYDPQEMARLPTDVAIREVAKSLGVIVILVPTTYPDAELHNMRAAFVAGLAQGLSKELLILQLGEQPTPLDFRDQADICYSEQHVQRAVDDFAFRIIPLLQREATDESLSGHTFLERLQLGSSVAENEFRDISAYYLKTDAYLRAERGEARVVLGRKGSGKTALFVRLRDEKRKMRDNVVIDLKPEGYKLLKFKEDVLSILQQGTLDDVVTALWDYVLLLEIAYKLLEKDRNLSQRDHEIYGHYRTLSDLYYHDGFYSEGDFSERLAVLLDEIKDNLHNNYAGQVGIRLSNPQVTELLYQHSIAQLRDCLVAYLRTKNEVWILIDNVDKGWPSGGLTVSDVALVRCLIDGVEKIRRQLVNRHDIPCFPVVFLRNDVYEHLVEHSSDRGKISSVSVDWTDREMLKELLRRRLVYAGMDDSLSFDHMWLRICTKSINDYPSIDYILDRALMRPRSLIDYVLACKGQAVNRQHSLIQHDDIISGTRNYSLDLVENISLEIRDVAPDLENVLYIFIDKPPSFSRPQLLNLLKEHRVKADRREEFVDVLLWYGVLGVEVQGGAVRYILARPCSGRGTPASHPLPFHLSGDGSRHRPLAALDYIPDLVHNATSGRERASTSAPPPDG